MGTIIGIDLGTTTSEVAFIKDNKPCMIPNSLGNLITPSVVGINEDMGVVVGEVAKQQLVLRSEYTVAEIKRRMGTKDNAKLGNKQYSPEEISGMILKYLKEYAEMYLGETVEEAVITVPAKFNNLQRQATKEAGKLAGLKVERILNEPTAAALAYGIEHKDSEQKVLVYDLGGGTFDVTVLDMFDGVIDIKSSRGNNMLGGKDFDERLMKYIIEESKQRYNIDLTKTKNNLARVREVAEKTKKLLSSLESTNIQLPYAGIDKKGEPININIKINRSKFEELICDLLNSTNDVIDEALEASGISPSGIDAVLLVGGSTRIPKVKEIVKAKFGNKVRTNINPDEAVALGAAVQAGIKSDAFTDGSDIIPTDVSPYTLGTSVVADVGQGKYVYGVFDVLIPVDTTIPCSVKKTYYTVLDNQRKMNIDVYQGDGRLVSENLLIGNFYMEGIPSGASGEQGIEVEFSYDVNGTLRVDATILSTGKKAGITIGKLESGSQKEKPISDAINKEFAEQVMVIIEATKARMNKLNAVDRMNAQKLIDKMKKAMSIGDNKVLEQYYDELITFMSDK